MMRKNKFLKIKEDLAEKIRNRHFQEGDLLPSENELVDMYSASRETIRKALNMLSEDGYIHKVQGKGSIVLDVSKFDFPISGLVSFKELAQKMGGRTKTPCSRICEKNSFSGSGEKVKVGRSRKDMASVSCSRD